VKAGARPAVTVASAGTANPIVSTVEDAVAAVTSVVAVVMPYLIGIWVLLLITLIVLVVRRRQRVALRAGGGLRRVEPDE
jgi:hypothetical protein